MDWMGHFNIVGLSRLSQMLGTVNLSLYEGKFSGGQHVRRGLKGANAPPPELLNNLYKNGYVYNIHQLHVLVQQHKGF